MCLTSGDTQEYITRTCSYDILVDSHSLWTGVTEKVANLLRFEHYV